MIDKIKKLREETGAGVMDAKRALEEANGKIDKAKGILMEKGMVKASKKQDREVGSGRVYAYIHQTGKVGAMIEMACETDYVAINEEFENLCKEVAMQVASMSPKDVKELMEQDYIRDSSKKIKDLVTELIAKIGENMKIVRFSRFELGEKKN